MTKLNSKSHTTDISNVLVIGSGGAGLRAAIEAKLCGLRVSIFGKRPKRDVHTILAAGGVNAAFGNVDADDSWKQHFADTYLEGYSIGDPSIIEIMAKEAPELVTEIDSWGANLEKLKDGRFDQRFFGAHTFRRTCYSGDYTGRSLINALLNKTKELKIPIFDSQYVTDLLVSEKVCFGVMSFNIHTGERTVHFADAVVLATGGHTRLWRKSSSRKGENTADGYYLALKAGCKLIDMEMVQFHPTGMVKPEEYAGTLVTEAVRGEGGRLLNSHGERFMSKYDPERMELSTRDRVAIANYREIMEGRGTKNGGVYLDISHLEKSLILKKLPRIYREFLNTQMLDITKEPMEVSPTAHYSMGGVFVTPEEHSTGISGLFAAGEVAGGLHGANRLGGNSLAEILVFGKRSGRSAAFYSMKQELHSRSQLVIRNAHENIDRFINSGKENPMFLFHSLRNVMWNYCGVVRNETDLLRGLNEVRSLKGLIRDLDIRIASEGCDDLIQALDLEASIFSAEATLISALERRESKGAHQRSDYSQMNSDTINYLVFLENNNELRLSSYKHSQLLDEDIMQTLSQTKEVKSLKGKLIE